MKTCSFPLSVLRAREVLNGAESTCVQQSCNNAQVRTDRTAEFPHAESFASCRSDSLIEIKSFPDGVNGLFISAQDKRSEMGHSVPTITGKNF
jgi:hypothetical protein